jgi:hypothetical protein
LRSMERLCKEGKLVDASVSRVEAVRIPSP